MNRKPTIVVAWFVPAAALLALFLSSGHCSAQGTFQWTVTFDGNPPIPPGDDIAVAQYFENGMWFRPIQPPDQMGRCGGGISYFPENGTTYLHAYFGDSLAVSSLSGLPFGLLSVDLAEFSTLYNFPQTVQFVGYLADGKTVTTEFTTDGIIDGTGPLADFQTFYFGEDFADIVRFEVPGYRYALDNMVFSNVIPEPGTWALMILGGGLLAMRFHQRGLRAAH